MSAVPGGIETEHAPPMEIPLRHFLVGLCFLLAAAAVGLLDALGVGPGIDAAFVHLALAGWVGVTIMGATTQFVPVWSGVRLHSRRLAAVQLPLAVVGFAGIAGSLIASRPVLTAPFGALAALGLWTFVYNLGRTIAAARPLDTTERRFAFALTCFAALPALGLLLAIDFAVPVLAMSGLDRGAVVGAHAALAIFGAVVTTLYAALPQLTSMFARARDHRLDWYLDRTVGLAHPLGVVLLAAGRLVGSESVAAIGGLAVATAALAMAGLLARRLIERGVGWTPLLRRYVVVAVAVAAWALLAASAWVVAPLDPAARFGAPGSEHLLVFGVVGFAVVGSLYHVVPFVVWEHRYADLLGLERVPTVDDLYDARIAQVDLVTTVAGVGALSVAGVTGTAAPGLWPAGSALVAVGFLLAAANLFGVVHTHGHLAATLLGRAAGDDRRPS